MDIAVFKKLSVAVVLMMLGVTAAFAGPPEPGRGAPGPSGGFGSRPGPPPDQDPNQRRGKLSVDERRELRRQIDEAGQDIYRAKR